ncbi:hypothetical protein BJ912DRAFT_974178 [Pholiota molesta]|nr:hypothetical protein BJ912DRAFT_974178 [Pholiota molesta]
MDIMADGIPTRIFQSPLDDSRLYRMELLGTFLSAIAFGIILVILLGTLQILLRKTRVYSRVMQVTLLCYVVLMSSMSLLALAQQIVFVIRRAPGGSDLGVGSSSTSGPRSQINQTVALPFAIWGADTFLMWRCTVLYTGVSKLHRAALLLVVVVAGLSSLGSGIFYFFTERFIDSSLSNLTTIFLVASSGLVNIVLRSLIVSRIVYHQRYIRKAMGNHYASIYTKIMTMLASVIPLILLPHICILTPLLLVYRVARGRNVTTLAASETMLQGTQPTRLGSFFLSGDFLESTRTLDNVYPVNDPSMSFDCVETDVTHVEYQRRDEMELAHVLPVSTRSSVRFHPQIYQ